MNPVSKALWYVESHFGETVTLQEVAAVSGVSRFHLTRAFREATGQPIMRYARGRRLTEAARILAKDAPDILTVALDAGYGSHEAFTRAFREQFGVTPEAVRAQPRLADLPLVEPWKLDETPYPHLDAPRLVDGRTLLIAGLGARYDCDSSKAIPSQWQRFGPQIGSIPDEFGKIAYGVCCNNDDDGNFDYICGVEVRRFSELPADLTRIRIAARRYAVFSHRDHISAIRRTVNTIWNQWLPDSGHEVADAPDFELYGPDFDPRSGVGLVEIWIPLGK